MGMFTEAPSQLLMLVLPLLTTVLVYSLGKPPPRIFRTAAWSALAGAALYILLLSFSEGLGPLLFLGYADTLLIYLPICVAMSALLVLGSKLVARRNTIC